MKMLYPELVDSNKIEEVELQSAFRCEEAKIFEDLVHLCLVYSANESQRTELSAIIDTRLS